MNDYSLKSLVPFWRQQITVIPLVIAFHCFPIFSQNGVAGSFALAQASPLVFAEGFV